MDAKDIPESILQALPKAAQKVQIRYGFQQEQMIAAVGGSTRQAVASILNGTRSSVSQSQGEAICSWFAFLEWRHPELKNYLRSVFSSNLPADFPQSLLEGSWMDIWFRIFPAPVPPAIDLRALTFTDLVPQIILDPSILAEPGILYALEDLTRSMLPDTSIFSRLIVQTNPSHYDVPLRSLEVLRTQNQELYRAVSSVLCDLQNKGVLQVCGDPKNDPTDPDEALLQGVEALCRYEPVMVMTNRKETARALQKFRRQKTPPFLLRAVKFENNCFSDWPEPTLSELLAEEPADREAPEFTYQPEKWSNREAPIPVSE